MSPNELSVYEPENPMVDIDERELVIESKIINYKFNPLGINQSKNKNHKIIEKLKLMLANHGES